MLWWIGHLHASLCVDMCFHFSWVDNWKWNYAMFINILRNCQTFSQEACAYSLPLPPCMRAPLVPVLTNTVSVCFFDYSCPNRYEVVSPVALICISLKADDAEHGLFGYLHTFSEERSIFYTFIFVYKNNIQRMLKSQLSLFRKHLFLHKLLSWNQFIRTRHNHKETTYICIRIQRWIWHKPVLEKLMVWKEEKKIIDKHLPGA